MSSTNEPTMPLHAVERALATLRSLRIRRVRYIADHGAGAVDCGVHHDDLPMLGGQRGWLTLPAGMGATLCVEHDGLRLYVNVPPVLVGGASYEGRVRIERDGSITPTPAAQVVVL